jgi:hypothetical protein
MWVGGGKLLEHCASNVVEGIKSISPSFLTPGWLLTETALDQQKETLDSRRGMALTVCKDRGQTATFSPTLGVYRSFSSHSASGTIRLAHHSSLNVMFKR